MPTKRAKNKGNERPPSYLGISSASDSGDFSIEKRTKQILSHISLEGCTILDCGCGNGLYTLNLGKFGKNIIGIDLRQEALIEATKNKVKLSTDAEFIRAEAESLPLRDSTCDILLLIEVLEHVRSQEEVLKEANRVLRSSGYLVIYVPNKLYPFETHGFRLGGRTFDGLYGSTPFLSWLPQSMRNKFERARIYTKGQIVRLTERHGFVVREVDHMYPPPSYIWYH
jgi:ubiquinone/menaquinone biosynthesis C-methylase UbiE